MKNALRRNCEVIRADDSDMSVQVLFSSETPVERVARKRQVELGIVSRAGEKYWEVLDHSSSENADFSELNRNAPVLDEHENEKQIGNVKRARLSKDKVGRALLSFDGDSEVSKTRYKQTAKGNRAISFGYEHTRFVGDAELPDGRKVKRIAFAAYEISSVANPADYRAGANRTADGGDEAICLGCGGSFSPDNLNKEHECEDCAGDGKKSRSIVGGFRLNRGGEQRGSFSFQNLMSWVRAAALDDPRFNLRPSGDLCSYIYVADIECDEKGVVNGEDVDVYSAIIQGADSKFYEVDFTFSDDEVKLGAERVVAQVITWEPVKDSSGKTEGERAALLPDGRLFRGDSKEPYGDVEYADPGYQKDGKKRYPINNKAHAKSAWSYINQKDNADKYTSEQLSHIKGKIKAALKKFGVETSDDGRSKDASTGETRSSNGGKTSTVDLGKKESATTQPKNFMILRKSDPADGGDNKPALTVDDINTPHVRARIAELAAEEANKIIGAARTKENGELEARNKEIVALSKEFSKDHGGKIGKRKLADGKDEPFYVRDAIRTLEMELCARDNARSKDLVIMEFRQKVDEICRNAAPERDVAMAVNSANALATRCDMFSGIRRMVGRAKEKGESSVGLQPFDGAEKEANDEIRAKLREVPGGSRLIESGGMFLPPNTASSFAVRNRESRSRKDRHRMATAEECRSREMITRDGLASNFATAGAFVQPEFMPYIELLRNKIALTEAGATFMGGLVGDVVFPRQDAATVGQSVAEGAQLQPYDQVLSQIRMTPKRCGSRQYYSRLAILQSTPDYEAFVFNDHSKVIALYIDEMGINGSGAGDQPTGIFNQPGIGIAAPFNGNPPTYQELITSFIGSIRSFNVEGPITFLTNSNAYAALQVLPAALVGSTVVSGQSQALAVGDEEDGKIVGRAAVVSQQIPNQLLLSGVFSNLLIGSWGGIVSVVDNYTRADRDEIALTLNTYFDIAVRHPQAFERSTDQVVA